MKKKPQIKEISSRYVLNELAEVWGFFVHSIPAEPRVFVAECSSNQHFSKPKYSVVLLLFGKKRLKKVDESMT